MGLLDNLNFSQPFRISSLLPSEAQLQAFKQKSDAEALEQFSQDPNPIRRVPFNILTALGVNPTIAQAAPTTLDVAPVTGDISALADARTAFGQGDLATAGLLTAATLIPGVPAGKVKSLLKADDTPKKGIQTILREKYPTADLDIFEMDKGIELSKIALPTDQRSQGLGSKIMKDLIDYADANNLKVATTPDTTFGGSSKKRLEDFYKNFGFKFNKNRNKDFDFKNSMIRQPKLSESEKAEKTSLLRAEANAQKFGEEVDTSYRVQHQPKGYDDDTPIRLDNLTKSITGEEAGYPDDFYTSRGRMLYAPPPRFPNDEYGIANTQSYDAILKARGNPEAEVTIYRAVPNEENITKINEGDFVTLSPKYAELHGASGYGSRGEDAGKILSQKVKVKDLLWDGNDVNEFGYFPSRD